MMLRQVILIQDQWDLIIFHDKLGEFCTSDTAKFFAYQFGDVYYFLIRTDIVLNLLNFFKAIGFCLNSQVCPSAAFEVKGKIRNCILSFNHRLKSFI